MHSYGHRVIGYLQSHFTFHVAKHSILICSPQKHMVHHDVHRAIDVAVPPRQLK